jgi:hypothetical protein
MARELHTDVGILVRLGHHEFIEGKPIHPDGTLERFAEAYE